MQYNIRLLKTMLSSSFGFLVTTQWRQRQRETGALNSCVDVNWRLISGSCSPMTTEAIIVYDKNLIKYSWRHLAGCCSLVTTQSCQQTHTWTLWRHVAGSWSLLTTETAGDSSTKQSVSMLKDTIIQVSVLIMTALSNYKKYVKQCNLSGFCSLLDISDFSWLWMTTD